MTKPAGRAGRPLATATTAGDVRPSMGFDEQIIRLDRRIRGGSQPNRNEAPMTNRVHESEPQLVKTGVDGLDDVLGGGLASNRLYLVEGDPGAGKTTLGLQFLLAGKARGERGMYVSLSETREELRVVAASHGWSLEGVSVTELAPSE